MTPHYELSTALDITTEKITVQWMGLGAM
jgi:hypothetical protein